MTKQNPEKTKSQHYIVVFPTVAVIGIMALYLVHTYRHQMFSLFASNQRGTKAALAAKWMWAQRLELPGVANFHKVSDELYRGAQLTAEGQCTLSIALPYRAGARLRQLIR